MSLFNKKNEIILVALNEAQIEHVKAANSPRKRYTHATVCEPYGWIFGTEKHCRKYFDAWKSIFADLFPRSRITADHAFRSYESTFDLVNILIAAQERRT